MKLLLTFVFVSFTFAISMIPSEANARWKRCDSTYYDLVEVRVGNRILWRVRQRCEEELVAFPPAGDSEGRETDGPDNGGGNSGGGNGNGGDTDTGDGGVDSDTPQ